MALAICGYVVLPNDFESILLLRAVGTTSISEVTYPIMGCKWYYLLALFELSSPRAMERCVFPVAPSTCCGVMMVCK
jgi:hypothetical protein